MVPVIKHKWVARQMVHKQQLKKLLNARRDAIKETSAGMSDNLPVSLSKKATDSIAKTNPKVQAIQDKIDEVEIIIEYLEKVENVISSLSWDCKNLIDLQKLETT
jgi:hypothetical protein